MRIFRLYEQSRGLHQDSSREVFYLAGDKGFSAVYGGEGCSEAEDLERGMGEWGREEEREGGVGTYLVGFGWCFVVHFEFGCHADFIWEVHDGLRQYTIG